jgi:hypothetical protein
MQNNQPNQEIVQELYRTLILLGAESDVLGAVGSWGNSLPDEDVLASLRAWNLATQNKLDRRTAHYEATFCRAAYDPDGELDIPRTTPTPTPAPRSVP